jgi:hypothetical protein
MSGVSCRDGERVRKQLHDGQFARERCGTLRLRQRIELRRRPELQRVELRHTRLQQRLDLRRPIELRRRIELWERQRV